MFLGLFFVSIAAQADVTCDTDKCSYTGTVKTVYINKSGLMIAYFDKSYPELLTGAAALGAESVTVSNAFALPVFADDLSIDEERGEVAKLFYSTFLTAQATGAEVTIQAREAHGAYMKADRIWLK